MQDEIGQKQFYLTPSHACSYLEGREARTLFLDPRDTHSADTYGRLSQVGFRRSGGHLYRPHCAHCRACVPTRIPVRDFRLTRRFKRVLKRNADIELRLEPAVFNQHHYELYAAYIRARHSEGDMYPPTPEQYRSFLLASWSDTHFLCAYLDGRLVAVAATDVLPDALSAIYTFFDPTLANRSLGVYSILRQIRECQKRGYPHLYLGYWIEGAAKMRYKTEYRPVELLANERWVVMS